jgi:ABC-type uncharacterized transport system substrate-binding protein
VLGTMIVENLLAAVPAQSRGAAQEPVYTNREFVEEGGLMSYGNDTADSYRRAGVHVGRILNGASPANLPVDQATQFELVVNVKAAKAIGLITDTTFLGPELVPKRLALLKEGLPKLSRIGVLWHPGAFSEATVRNLLVEVREAAKALSLQPQLAEARSPDEVDGAFARMIAERAQAVFVFPSSMLFSQRRRIVELTTKHALPSTFPAREYAQLGGLMAYGASITDLWRRSAAYVDRIFKGAKPSELPVEQPTRFELVLNLKTAKALGLEISPTLLARADEVIE